MLAIDVMEDDCNFYLRSVLQYPLYLVNNLGSFKPVFFGCLRNGTDEAIEFDQDGPFRHIGNITVNDKLIAIAEDILG